MSRAIAIIVTLALAGLAGAVAARGDADRPPNVVIIYVDDMGYGDPGCFGARGNPTPNVDRMAAEGRRFTDFYVAQAVCSASRAALMTGCYPNRIGILYALLPGSKIGINPDETTLAELLKSRGFATAAYGKWHLGDAPKFLPTRHGFDDYYGLPYSNDMLPSGRRLKDDYPDLPLLDREKVVALNPDQSRLTTDYTERAVRFIAANKARPFFLYMPHTMVHVPLAVSSKFRGKSPNGLYGDAVMEVDWSVGQVLKALKDNGIDEQTLVIFTSDNGPWLCFGDHAGSAGPLREGKMTTFEGGHREPCVMRWPGHIPAGTTCREPVMTIDLFPTIARLVGAGVPKGRKIDGLDISPLILGKPGAKSPHEALYFYWDNGLEAIRSGHWKLHFPHDFRSLGNQPRAHGGQPVPYFRSRIVLALFDLETDPGERLNVADDHPDVVARLSRLADAARADLGDSLTGVEGKGTRPPGKL
ncbi:MAG TPA: sulfatase [Isosphaeraceae bacterium]|jgi:arylsulfatase A|nr:sulfatase [Isosphaeraceae bacterium]